MLGEICEVSDQECQHWVRICVTIRRFVRGRHWKEFFIFWDSDSGIGSLVNKIGTTVFWFHAGLSRDPLNGLIFLNHLLAVGVPTL